MGRVVVEVELIAVTKYLQGNGTLEELLEHAGRVCYRSEKRGEAGSFLQARIREGHQSIIEHASATFEISGISRACSHQLVRHRIASYSQESQRYVDMNFRELRHFFKLRCDRAAQWEIRALAKEMLKLVYQIAPSVFQDLYTEFIGEGTADA